ncbi:hypothetical protein IW261DRAFT_1567608 [Armillaria novae-zelandiae]|uniref:Uncharacterized protein n=1 Tax=Armillaria novae-zelandiae TaxID=153914 RepID=A0AA39P1H1_9AGAR|nr:hypothetical protein IW261DRAFT_1567608 [Armillaria novae-zelandiae]
MSAPETGTKFSSAKTSSIAGGQLVGRSNKGTVAPKETLKLRLDLNLEVEIAIQAKVNGDITLSLLKRACIRKMVLERSRRVEYIHPLYLRSADVNLYRSSLSSISKISVLEFIQEELKYTHSSGRAANIART